MTQSSSPSLPVSPDGDSPKLTGVQWLICIIAVIGFAFDTYELLMLPLVLRPALMELGGFRPGTPEFSHWFSLLFYIPAVAGGVFGLLGGYLTDRLGRRRVLTWSILIYGFSAFFAGFATSLPMLLVLRTTTFIGVCVEFVAAVAWLAELFPNPKQRERVLGYTQAFSSIGGFMVAWVNHLAVDWSTSSTLPHVHIPAFLHPAATHGIDAGWRYTLMSGLIPAIPLIVIRPFLPESPVWRERKRAGTLRRPSVAELFSPALRRTTIVATLMFACSLGAAFGAIQQMPQVVPALPELPKLVDAEMAKRGPATTPAGQPAAITALPGTQPVTKPAIITAAPPATQPAKGGPATAAGPPNLRQVVTGQVVQATASSVTKVQEIGGLVGRFVLAFLAVRILSRRTLIRVFQIPGIIVMPLVFGWAATHGLNMLKVGMFVAGFLTVAQLSFWGNYLPRVYPVHLRGTGESFAANIGGRMIGTVFAAVTALIAAAITPDTASLAPAAKAAMTAKYWAYTAAGVGTFVYLAGLVLSFFLPEPPATDVDE